MVKTIGNVQEDGQVRAVASGALSNGDTIIVNSDGTVSAVSGNDSSVGTPVTFNTGSSTYKGATFDSSNNKVVVAYTDGGNSNYGTAIVGTVSGSSITFGTAVVFSSTSTFWPSATFDTNSNKVVIAYKGTSSYGYAIVGTVSGTSISFGSQTSFESANTEYIGTTFDSSNNKVIIAYMGSSSWGRAVVGTVSGTSISFGSTSNFNVAATNHIGITFDSYNNKAVIVYRHSNVAKAKVATVSGTSITFGAEASISGNDAIYLNASFDSSNNKIVTSYRDFTNSNYQTAAVGTVSGTSISFGTAVVFSSATGGTYGNTFDPVTNKVVLFYDDQFVSGKLVVGTVSGTSISFDSPITFDTSRSDFISSTFDSNSNKVVAAYRDLGDSSYGKAVVFSPASTNLTSDNFIGFADGSYADTQSAAINSTCSVGEVSFSTFDIANASYDSVSFTPVSGISSPRNVLFSSDGTKMFINEIGGGNNNLHQYNLSTAWDITTAAHNSSFDLSGQDSGVSAGSAFFRPDGLKYYMAGTSTPVVFEYDLSTAYTVSTMSYSGNSKNISGQITGPAGIWFYSNGTKLILGGTNTDALFQYTLSTAWNISTASYDSVSFSLSGQSSAPYSLYFNTDGTKLFVLGGNNDEVYQYSASTPYDISTLSYDNVSFSVTTEANTPTGMTFKDDGSKMYILQNPNDTVYQYSTQQSLTAGQKYYVQSDGTLSTTAGSPTVEAGTAISPTKILVKG